jgi:hypothetical protein
VGCTSEAKKAPLATPTTVTSWRGPPSVVGASPPANAAAPASGVSMAMPSVSPTSTPWSAAKRVEMVTSSTRSWSARRPSATTGRSTSVAPSGELGGKPPTGP